MNYPKDFPEHLKPKVDAAIHRAEADYISEKASGTGTGYITYTKSVFFAFAEQCVRAAKEGIWNGERVRKALDEFRETLLTHVYYGKFSSGRKTEIDYHSFHAEILRYSRAWPEWQSIYGRFTCFRDAVHHGDAVAGFRPLRMP